MLYQGKEDEGDLLYSESVQLKLSIISWSG